MTGFLQWLISWLIMLAILYALSQTRAGHTIIYYGAWLLVVLLLVLEYKPITAILAAGNITGQQ